jgi:hypothetical protein
MYRLVSNISKSYDRYLKTAHSEGICMGMTLTWLGDVLKNSKGRSPDKCLQKTVFPVSGDEAALVNFYERSFSKQENYLKRVDAYQAKGGRESDVKFMAAYKDRKQRIVEAKNKVPGLHYRNYPLKFYREIKGLDADKASLPAHQGVVIFIDILRQEQNSHATGAIRISEEVTYFLDPNYGLYRIDSKEPNKEIENILYGHYGRFYFYEQIVVTN